MALSPFLLSPPLRSDPGPIVYYHTRHQLNEIKDIPHLKRLGPDSNSNKPRALQTWVKNNNIIGQNKKNKLKMVILSDALKTYTSDDNSDKNILISNCEEVENEV